MQSNAKQCQAMPSDAKQCQALRPCNRKLSPNYGRAGFIHAVPFTTAPFSLQGRCRRPRGPGIAPKAESGEQTLRA
eukprot:165116-Pyramimonas_sp.AAC.1